MLKIIIMFIAATLIGCLFHFTYELSHKNKFCAIFSAVNESTWEHIKIGIGALVIVFASQLLAYPLSNVVVAAALSIATFIVLVPALFYPILALMGKHSVVVSILEFAFAIFASVLLFDTLVQLEYTSVIVTVSAAVLIATILAWGLFTFFPPKFFLFRDSRNGKYGLKAFQKIGHKHHH